MVSLSQTISAWIETNLFQDFATMPSSGGSGGSSLGKQGKNSEIRSAKKRRDVIVLSTAVKENVHSQQESLASMSDDNQLPAINKISNKHPMSIISGMKSLPPLKNSKMPSNVH